MSCSLTYKEAGIRTIEIGGFHNVRSAVRFANERGINSYNLTVKN